MPSIHTIILPRNLLGLMYNSCTSLWPAMGYNVLSVAETGLLSRHFLSTQEDRHTAAQALLNIRNHAFVDHAFVDRQGRVFLNSKPQSISFP